jgi:hypothetical protein
MEVAVLITIFRADVAKMAIYNARILFSLLCSLPLPCAGKVVSLLAEQGSGFASA